MKKGSFSVRTLMHLYIHPSIYLSIYLSIYQSIYPLEWDDSLAEVAQV